MSSLPVKITGVSNAAEALGLYVPVSGAAPTVLAVRQPWQTVDVSAANWVQIHAEDAQIRWKGNEGTALDAFDFVPASTPLMRNVAASPAGTALDFGTTGFTWEFWKKIEAPVTGNNNLIESGGSSGSDPYLRLDFGGATTSQLEAQILLRLGGADRLTLAGSVTDVSGFTDYGETAQIAVVVARTGTASSTVKLYINGTQAHQWTWDDSATAATNFNISGLAAGGAGIRFGAVGGSSRDDGKLYSIKAYKSPLELSDIKSLHKAGPAKNPTTVTDPSFILNATARASAGLFGQAQWASGTIPEAINASGTVVSTLSNSSGLAFVPWAAGAWPTTTNTTALNIGERAIVDVGTINDLNIYSPPEMTGQATVRVLSTP